MMLLTRSPAEQATPRLSAPTTTRERLINGGLAGIIATAPMTWTMRAAARLLPWTASRRLPPRQIAEATLRATDDGRPAESLDAESLDAFSTLSHYAYGAVGGAVLGVLAVRSPWPRPVTGAAFGLAVWAGSYLGWLPAAGIRESALQDRKERSLQMIAAHLVWGAAAATLMNELGVEDR